MVRQTFATLACCMSLSSLAVAAEAEPARFSRHIIPLFSKLGCNAGNCHGAVQGQNGFRLSLFGVEPERDHAMLLRDFAGRRLNPHQPEQSLLLLKTLGRVPHQGGPRASFDSREYQALAQWVLRGTPLDSVAQSRITNLTVSPARHVLKAGESTTLKVAATFADGTTEDVTWLCTFESQDREVASVDVSGTVQGRSVGDSAIVVRYGFEPVMATVVVPRTGPEAFPTVKTNNFIDEHVVTKLKQLNVPPSDLCDDATFLRRASLDIAGTLPNPEEVRKFLADSSADKRTRKIDELLTRPEHDALWATKFCDLLKASGFNGNFALSEAAETRRFHEWLRARVAENLPYDQLVERVLLATSREGRTAEAWLEEVMTISAENAKQSPDLVEYGKRKTLDLYWQREGATGLKGAMQAAHSFLGLRLECAQCHRHPHDVWKQDDLLSFANFFMRLKGAAYPDAKTLPAKYAEMMKKAPNDSKQILEEAKKLTEKAKDKKISPEEAEKLKAEAAALQMKAKAMQDGPKRFGTEVIHQTERTSYASVTSPLGTQKSEKFRLLGQTQPVAVPKEKDPRELVMEWMRRPDNPFFAKAIVNRIWAHYFGRGLVDPVDHLSPLNPASHPELLQALADGFIKAKYDLRWLHRTIAGSRSYQLSCQPTDANRIDRRNYAYFYLRRLSAEIIVDAMNDATGTKETYPAKLFLPANARAIQVAGTTRVEDQTAALDFAMKVFGRPSRNPQVQCDCERDDGATMVQTLYIANHPRVREKIAAPDGRVARIIKEIPEDRRRVEELFLCTISRPPTAEQLESCMKHLKESKSAQKGLEDVLWSLLNTREFLLNH